MRTWHSSRGLSSGKLCRPHRSLIAHPWNPTHVPATKQYFSTLQTLQHENPLVIKFTPYYATKHGLYIPLGLTTLRRPTPTPPKAARPPGKAQYTRCAEGDSSLVRQRRGGEVYDRWSALPGSCNTPPLTYIEHSEPRAGICPPRSSKWRLRYRHLRPFDPNAPQPVWRTAPLAK